MTFNITPQAKIVTIYTADNGYLATVGCKNFVFESRAELLSKLGEYLENPGLVEDEYMLGYPVPAFAGAQEGAYMASSPRDIEAPAAGIGSFLRKASNRI
jgi:hypothetical protein